jgi:hypothetical protein
MTRVPIEALTKKVRAGQTASYVDCALAALGILCLTFLSVVHKDWPAAYVVGSLSALAVRATGLLLHAFSLGRHDG